jgi:hypothetical protein
MAHGSTQVDQVAPAALTREVCPAPGRDVDRKRLACVALDVPNFELATDTLT